MKVRLKYSLGNGEKVGAASALGANGRVDHEAHQSFYFTSQPGGIVDQSNSFCIENDDALTVEYFGAGRGFQLDRTLPNRTHRESSGANALPWSSFLCKLRPPVARPFSQITMQSFFSRSKNAIVCRTYRWHNEERLGRKRLQLNSITKVQCLVKSDAVTRHET